MNFRLLSTICLHLILLQEALADDTIRRNLKIARGSFVLLNLVTPTLIRYKLYCNELLHLLEFLRTDISTGNVLHVPMMLHAGKVATLSSSCVILHLQKVLFLMPRNQHKLTITKSPDRPLRNRCLLLKQRRF